MAGPRSRERMARNFVSRYGAGRLAELLDALGEGRSGQLIAEEFEVSRERVRQWKNAFGAVVTFYDVHPDIRRVLDDVG